MEKKLSVIIPCYNCEETLEEAVNSIYKQSIDIPFEIIMVDDGSTDNTRALLKSLAEEYKELKIFFHNENMGGGATRNTAVSNSTGTVIFCLDSDDVLPPSTLPKMYKYLEEKKCDGVTFHKSIKFNGSDTENINHIDTSDFVDKKILLRTLFSKEIKFQPLDVNFMYTSRAFKKTGGYPTDHGFDTQGFCWKFLCRGLIAYTCPETTYLHRVNFKESYYLRDYNSGKINYNWQKIFLENYHIFNEKALNFIKKFNCRDFTQNILTELKNMDDILVDDVEISILEEHAPSKILLSEPKYVKINSLLGFFFRIRSRLKK